MLELFTTFYASFVFFVVNTLLQTSLMFVVVFVVLTQNYTLVNGLLIIYANIKLT